MTPEDQLNLKNWLGPFISNESQIEEWLTDKTLRSALKQDINRIKTFPVTPKAYSNPIFESEQIANEFLNLATEADRALEDPKSLGDVKRMFQERLESVLSTHLPSSLEKVWLEITLCLTSASWLLPIRPELHLEERGKSLSIQLKGTDKLLRYIYNSAERHVLGLAWFFTYYLAKRRFDEAWMFLDDPAQEMDQSSYREFVRFLETILRIFNKRDIPLSLLVALHQEERALDMARATNGRMHLLGWKKLQDSSTDNGGVKKIMLLAPGYHPIKPDEIFT